MSFDFIRDLIVELLLNLGVLGENKWRTRQGRGRRVVSGQQEGNRLLANRIPDCDELLTNEIARTCAMTISSTSSLVKVSTPFFDMSETASLVSSMKS